MQQQKALIGGGGEEGHGLPIFTVSCRVFPEEADGGFTFSKGQTK